MLKGSSCQFIDLESVLTEGSGCVDGTKFVVGQERGVSSVQLLLCINMMFQTRKQFLFIEGKSILAFIKNGDKFADCETYVDVTADVVCKVIHVMRILHDILSGCNRRGKGAALVRLLVLCRDHARRPRW